MPFVVECMSPVSSTNLAELLALEKLVFRKADSWADGELQRTAARRNCVVVVARQEGGKLCGYVLCTSTGLNLHVSKIAVREDCRRQGIARALMQEVLHTAATQRRSMSSTLHVALDNEAASKLYRCGCGWVGGEDYYTPGRHAYKMICELEPYKAAGAAGGGGGSASAGVSGSAGGVNGSGGCVGGGPARPNGKKR
ncbi:hypothetical protein TSOC_011055 [Tetrabaena socialis]|uniref:N-acetyltransferase domain-containing protein n=1 Tax=Tetrabaena socialis TaxID=47790 RepID=A0A2J7ZRP3_9CHLO|nr:hypothetical protein TSOC_011055 [Tetrabaena socialis]|eukprot:PNH02939.1 hypothetical protein TSOC_011055 [Tetrabaena socialis]